MLAPYPSNPGVNAEQDDPCSPLHRSDRQERHMSDASNVAKNLRERLSPGADERLGKALSDLLENPLLTGAIGRAFGAREKAVQAQEVAMGALNLPSAADIERLTRRLRSLSHRLEGIEDGVDRLDRSTSAQGVEARLTAIETELRRLADALDRPSASDRGAGSASGGQAGGAAASGAAGASKRPETTGRPKRAATKAPARARAKRA
jgi:hypothetical protein